MLLVRTATFYSLPTALNEENKASRRRAGQEYEHTIPGALVVLRVRYVLRLERRLPWREGQHFPPPPQLLGLTPANNASVIIN